MAALEDKTHQFEVRKKLLANPNLSWDDIRSWVQIKEQGKMLKELCEDRKGIETKNPEMVHVSELRNLQKLVTDFQNLLLKQTEKSPIIQSRAAATPARSDLVESIE